MDCRKGEIINDKLTPKMIRKAMKILWEHEIKPDEDGFIEIKNPRECFDLLDAIEKISIHIDNDIRNCIKKEIRENGSIVGRYGDWAKFINKEIGIAHYPINPRYLFHQSLFYRGKHIRNYIIAFEGIMN